MKLRKNFQILVQIVTLLIYFFNRDVWAHNDDDSESTEQIFNDELSDGEKLHSNLSDSNFVNGDLKVINSSLNSLTISWNHDSEDVVESYRIEWFKDEESVGNASIYPPECTFIIEKLETCTTYKIRVTPSFETHFGEYMEVNASTCCIRPSEVTNIVAKPLKIDGDLQLNISWEAPAAGKSCIKYYELTLEATVHDRKHTVKKDTTATNILIYHLHACTSYKVKIRVIDVYDIPSRGSEILAPSTLPKAALPPKLMNKINVQPFETTSTTITLNWNVTNEKNNCTVKSVRSTCNYVYSLGSGYELRESDKEVIVLEESPRNVSVVVDDLSPCTVYHCYGQVINTGGWSFYSMPISVLTKEAVPSAPEDFKNEGFLFSWKAPQLIPGRLKRYRMTFFWEPLYPVPEACRVIRKAVVDNIDKSLKSYYWKRGEGYSRYSAYIEAETGAGWGTRSTNLTFDSDVNGVPDEVTNLRYALEPLQQNPNELEAKLWWNLPCSLKGVLNSFDVWVHGVKDGMDNHTIHITMPVSHDVQNDAEFYLNLGELNPEYYYQFDVAAMIQGSPSRGAVARYWAIFPAGIPPEPEKKYMQTITLHPSKILRTTFSFEILLPLFADSSGDIRYYAIIVSRQDSHYKPAEKRYNLKEKGWPNISSWRESMEVDFKIAYQVTEPFWTPYPNYILDYGSIKAVKFVVGNDITCKDVSLTTKNKLYCNGPLNPDTWYEVRMRAFTSGGYSDSPPFLVKTKAEISAILIVSIVLGLLVLGMILSMIIAGKIYFKRKEKKSMDEDTDQRRRESRRMTLTALSGYSQDTSSRVRSP